MMQHYDLVALYNFDGALAGEPFVAGESQFKGQPAAIVVKDEVRGTVEGSVELIFGQPYLGIPMSLRALEIWNRGYEGPGV